MISFLLASHDPLEHVLPHRLGERLFHIPVNFSLPLNLLHIGPHDFYFTNQLLMTLVAAGIMLIMFPMMGRRYAAMLSGAGGPSIPRGFTGVIETMLEFVRTNVARPVLADKTDRFMPFLWTVFFYILICNLLGMIPLDSFVYVGSRAITGHGVEHIGGTATGNIMVTAGLAICAFFMIHIAGAREIYLGLRDGTYGHHHHDSHSGHTADDHALHGEGHSYGLAYGLAHEHVDTVHPNGMSVPAAVIAAPFLYIWNFAPHVFKPEKTGSVSSLLMWIMDIAMWVVLLTLEFIGAVIKPFALAIRLFANMVAGHVVLASILALIFAFKGAVLANWGLGIVAAAGAAALSFLELFVCFLQAYVFTFLTTLFIGASVAPEH